MRLTHIRIGIVFSSYLRKVYLSRVRFGCQKHKALKFERACPLHTLMQTVGSNGRTNSKGEICIRWVCPCMICILGTRVVEFSETACFIQNCSTGRIIKCSFLYCHLCSATTQGEPLRNAHVQVKLNVSFYKITYHRPNYLRHLLEGQ